LDLLQLHPFEKEAKDLTLADCLNIALESGKAPKKTSRKAPAKTAAKKTTKASTAKTTAKKK
jgi:topoisomerase IA-like protein